MKPVPELLRNITKAQQERLEKATKIAQNQVKTAEAAAKAYREQQGGKG